MLKQPVWALPAVRLLWHHDDPIIHSLTVSIQTHHTACNDNPLYRGTIKRWYYLEVERLFHPGPWKQTLRHHKNRSSQYVDLAAGDHPKYTGERARLPHKTSRLQDMQKRLHVTRCEPGCEPRPRTVVLSCRRESLRYCTLPAPLLFAAAADFQAKQHTSDLKLEEKKRRITAQAQLDRLEIKRFSVFRFSN